MNLNATVDLDVDRVGGFGSNVLRPADNRSARRDGRSAIGTDVNVNDQGGVQVQVHVDVNVDD